MPLDDEQFKLGDSGVVLNSDVATPFVDIMRVTGLDSAPYRETVRDHEGTDGGFIDAEFEKGRDIILEGLVYCDLDNVETFLDDLKENYAPVTSPEPFYIKTAGVDERVVFVKPRGVRFDWDQARRIGMTNAQFLMYAEDPRIYDNDLISIVIPFGGEASTGFGFENIIDTFTRNEVDTFGDTDTGETWVQTGGSASDRSVQGTFAQYLLSTVTTGRFDTLDTNQDDFDLRWRVRVPQIATGASFTVGGVGRFQDGNSYYDCGLVFNTDSDVDLRVRTVVSGVAGSTAATNQFVHDIDAWYNVHFNGSGERIRASAWVDGDPEPDWIVTRAVTDFTTGDVGLRCAATTGNTNVNPLIQYDKFQVVNGFGFDLGFGPVIPPVGAFVIVGGNRPTPAIMTITGPITNPRILNETDGKSLNFTIELSASDELTIDLANRTVVLNGTTNRRSALTTTDWFLFNPGSTFIRFGGGAGTGSTLAISYRNAWR